MGEGDLSYEQQLYMLYHDYSYVPTEEEAVQFLDSLQKAE
jgi:hypothetical protein